MHTGIWRKLGAPSIFSKCSSNTWTPSKWSGLTWWFEMSTAGTRFSSSTSTSFSLGWVSDFSSTGLSAEVSSVILVAVGAALQQSYPLQPEYGLLQQLSHFD